MDFKSCLKPIAVDSGFRMDGYHIWCGSPVRGEDGRIYLFAARWPEHTGFPQGYMHHSEIVLARAEAPDRPFTYVKTVLSGRGGGFWDGQMTHNPQITRIGGRWVLYYIGNSDGTWETRAIGYATADSLTGEWTRVDRPLALPANANNPAVYVEDDGGVLLIFRDGNLKVSAARAPRYDGAYTLLNGDVTNGLRLEDFYVYKENGRYVMLAEDNVGAYSGHERWGVVLTSDDGVHWFPRDPLIAYDHTLPFADGTSITAERRERPQLLLENGVPVALFTGVLYQGKTWNQAQLL